MCAAYFNLDIGRLGHKPSHQYGKYVHGSQLISTRTLVVGTQAKSPIWQTCSWIADNLNQDIGHWDTCQVTDMANMVTCAACFNQDIGRLGHMANMNFFQPGRRSLGHMPSHRYGKYVHVRS